MTMNRNSSQEEAVLRWACRRGMLELDLLFGQFLDKHFRQLQEEDKALFRELLGYTDQELYRWLMGQGAPEDARLHPLLDKIREYLPCKST